MGLYKRRLKAQFTAEAALLVPLLLFLLIVVSYLVIYSYNKALMYQDMNIIASEIRISEEAFANACQVIKEKRAYFGVNRPSIYINENGYEYEFTLICEWNIPVFPGTNRSIVVKRNIDIISPIEIMRITDDIEDTVKEYGNEK